MSTAKSNSPLFAKGLAVRREVLGADYVDKSLADADDFMMAFQNLTTEWCWGEVWARPGLSRKTRSMLNLAMLTALNRPAELKLHLRGALTNGVTRDELAALITHLAFYAGFPAAISASAIAARTLTD